LLVNTSDSYSGIVPIDLPPNTITKYLEINAVGSWQIIVLPIGMSETIELNEKKDMSGDDVLWIEGDAIFAEIFGNSASRHFSIIAYDKYGRYSKLLVNTSDFYSGKVMLPKDTLLLEVNAVGNWSITVK